MCTRTLRVEYCVFENDRTVHKQKNSTRSMISSAGVSLLNDPKA